MDLRLIEVLLPDDGRDRLEDILDDYPGLRSWRDRADGGLSRARILLSAEKTEGIMDRLEKAFEGIEGFQILMLPVEAAVPRPEEPEGKEARQDAAKAAGENSAAPRISREELYGDIEKTAHLSWIFSVLVALSTAVAAIGILRGDTVIIIGAMVIAPLLGPNVALSLSTTLGDGKLARQAVRTAAAGFLLALLLAALIGLFTTVDPLAPEVLARTRVSLADIVLALAAGGAAALSFTSGLLSALIGVMVAAALLPPLVTLGLLVGNGEWRAAYEALLLLLTNVICINLSGVVVFLAQGVRPRSWGEAEKARKASRRALAVWTGLLAVLAALIYLSGR